MYELDQSIKKTKHNILILYIFFLGTLIFILTQVPVRNQINSFYNNYNPDQLNDSGFISTLPPKLQNQLSQIASYEFLNNQDYDNAINAIKGQDSPSYYNLGTIKTLQAYDNALGSTLSGLQKARYLITEATKNFDTASQIKLNNTLDQYIQQNQILSKKLGVIIQIKTCYSEYQNTISSLQDFQTQLNDTKKLLQQEANEIQKNKNLNSQCLNNLQKINNISQLQLDLLNKQIHQYDLQYKSNLIDNINNPAGCLNDTLTDIQPTIIEAFKAIQEFKDNHQTSIDTLKSTNSKDLNNLCNQAKDDSQINEKIENSLNKLMKQLQNNLDKQQKNKDQENPEPSLESSYDISGNHQQSSIEYKSIFKDKELQLLQEIDNNNKSLIRQIQQIKGKGGYNPENLLNKLFDQFFGNPSDFQNNLQTPAIDNKW